MSKVKQFNNEGIALYIHIPFCKQKCLYCDFPSFSGKEELMLDYAHTLSQEISNLGKIKIKSIFIGGGTPTYLSLNAWKVLKRSINELNKENNIEFTVEANPGTFTVEKLKFLKDLGVNRLSIGLQAWQDYILKSLGRIHTVDEFKRSFIMARKLGFNNINVDIMFGLPGQTLENWIETLNNVLLLNPEHISCYSLIIEKGTPFYERFKNNKLKLPKEEIERNMYLKTLEILNSKGYSQYEISNFCKKDKECKHNLVYWNLGDYIGCGSSAHSYFKNKRARNFLKIEKYIKHIKNSKSPIEESHLNSLQDNMEEFMFLGLRKTKGISIEEFNNKFQVDIYDVYGDVICKYLKNKLLIKEQGRLFLSPRGIELSNSVMCEFILT